MKGKISEIFESIQGEGLYFGEKQLFVRFFGCNLKCAFCDTKFEHFIELTPRELLDKLKSYHDRYHSVAFTGGEPLLQKDFLREVVALTKAAGFKNYLETNGTLPDALIEVIDYFDIVAMDLKFPSSTGFVHFWPVHRQFLSIASQKEVFVKAVVCQSTSEDDLIEGLKTIKEINPFVVLVLQPNSFEDEKILNEKIEKFKEICRGQNILSCLIPQLHKTLGVK